MFKHQPFLFGILIVLSASWAQPLQAGSDSVMGFSATSAAQQLDLEKDYDSLLEAGDQAAWMKQLALAPHHVGSPAQTFEQVAAQVEQTASIMRELATHVARLSEITNSD